MLIHTHTHTHTHTPHQNKCYPYWPQAGEEPLQCDKFRVENLGCEDESFYHLSHLKLENTEVGNEEREGEREMREAEGEREEGNEGGKREEGE